MIIYAVVSAAHFIRQRIQTAVLVPLSAGNYLSISVIGPYFNHAIGNPEKTLPVNLRYLTVKIARQNRIPHIPADHSGLFFYNGAN